MPWLGLTARYLGNDFIFSIVGAILVPIYWQRRRLGWALFGVLVGSSCTATMIVCINNHLGNYIFDVHYAKVCSAFAISFYFMHSC